MRPHEDFETDPPDKATNPLNCHSSFSIAECRRQNATPPRLVAAARTPLWNAKEVKYSALEWKEMSLFSGSGSTDVSLLSQSHKRISKSPPEINQFNSFQFNFYSKLNVNELFDFLKKYWVNHLQKSPTSLHPAISLWLSWISHSFLPVAKSHVTIKTWCICDSVASYRIEQLQDTLTIILILLVHWK